MFPCLLRSEARRGRAGSAACMLRRIDARFLVLSFPARSLGGHGKGMRRHYREEASRLASEFGGLVDEMAFPTETFYVFKTPAKG